LPFLAQSLVADILPVRARVALYAGPLGNRRGVRPAGLAAVWPYAAAAGRRVPAAPDARPRRPGGSLVWRTRAIGADGAGTCAFTRVFTFRPVGASLAWFG